MSHQLHVAFAVLIVITVLALAGIRLANDDPSQPLITLGSETPCNCRK